MNISQTIREKLQDELYGTNYIYDEAFSKIKLENASSWVDVCMGIIYIYIYRTHAHSHPPNINWNEMTDLCVMKIKTDIVNIFKSYESPDWFLSVHLGTRLFHHFISLSVKKIRPCILFYTMFQLTSYFMFKIEFKK